MYGYSTNFTPQKQTTNKKNLHSKVYTCHMKQLVGYGKFGSTIFFYILPNNRFDGCYVNHSIIRYSLRQLRQRNSYLRIM